MTVKNRPAAALGVTMLLLGIAILISARNITSGFSYDAVGPSVFPTIIGFGFLLSAMLIIVESVRLEPSDDWVPINWRPFLIISAAILLDALLIGHIGWLPMATMLFVAGAWAFGERRHMLTVLFGIGLAGLILFSFNWGLGLDLPLGILSPLFPATN